MRLIVGLGNPGEKYNKTRHNTGFIVVDELKNQISNDKFQMTNWIESKKFQSLVSNNSQSTIHDSQLILAKPQTFMNDSGLAVLSLSNFYKVQNQDIFIIHDDLDVRLGEYKIQMGIGPKVHGGINSIETKLGSGSFYRVRIGIDNRDLSNRVAGEAYVLQNFTGEEINTLEKVIDEVCLDIIKKIS